MHVVCMCVVHVWCMCGVCVVCIYSVCVCVHECGCGVCYHQNKVMAYSPIYDIIKVHVRVCLCVCNGRSAEAISS